MNTFEMVLNGSLRRPTPRVMACVATLGLLLSSALGDTPEELADPEALRAATPQLAAQKSWKDYATPEQIRLFDGPATVWPEVPASRYRLDGFDPKILGGKLPPPGVHPRLLFSPEDVPAIAARLKSSLRGQKALLENATVLNRTLWNLQSDEGKIFLKLSTGDLADLAWPENEDVAPGFKSEHFFKGWTKQMMGSTHAGYLPYLLAAAAFDCLLRQDAEQGKKVATALASYYQLREPLIDRLNGEYNDQKITPNDFWRPMHQLIGNDNLAWGYDCAATWMTEAQKTLMRRVISKATKGKRSYGMNGPTRWRDTNWVGWDLQFFLTTMAIEGEEGYDPAIYPKAKETARAYLDWGINENGTILETNGKNGAGFEYAMLSLQVLARHGDNLFGHPHLRKLTAAQCAMVAPAGEVNVNNGTWGGNTPFWGNLCSLLKSYYTSDLHADWLLRQAQPDSNNFDPKAYAAQLEDPKAKLPVPWTKFTLVTPPIAFEMADWTGLKKADGTLCEAWEREALKLPLTFADSTHGIISARSGLNSDALFLHFEARPDQRGVGHQHHDAGHFYLGALGEMWAIEASPKNSFSSDHNTVLIDGKGHSDVSAAPRVEWLGTQVNDNAAFASANLKNAYDYGWCTPMHFSWSLPGRVDGTWKLQPDTSPELVAYYKGTQKPKMRIWGSHHFMENWGPAMRIEGNPVRSAFRTAGLVRGKRPYAVICDTRDKDGQEHIYDWLMQVPEGVRLASLSLPKNSAPGVILTRAAVPGSWGRESADRNLPKGTPALLVSLLIADKEPTEALAPNTVGSEKLPIRLEQVALKDVPGSKPTSSRLVITRRAVDPEFKILLIPFRIGEPIPLVGWNESDKTAELNWPDQLDKIQFNLSPNQPICAQIQRNGKEVIYYAIKSSGSRS